MTAYQTPFLTDNTHPTWTPGVFNQLLHSINSSNRTPRCWSPTHACLKSASRLGALIHLQHVELRFLTHSGSYSTSSDAEVMTHGTPTHIIFLMFIAERACVSSSPRQVSVVPVVVWFLPGFTAPESTYPTLWSKSSFSPEPLDNSPRAVEVCEPKSQSCGLPVSNPQALIPVNQRGGEPACS